MGEGARVLVTDAETRACVAAARGLQQAGFHVTAAACTRLPPPLAHWSRGVNVRVITPSPLRDAPWFIAALEHTVAAGDISVLLPGTDAALISVSAARARLEPHARLGLPSADAVRRALDKSVLTAAAERHGLPGPLTVHCHTPEDIRGAVADLGPAVLIKSVRSVIGDADGHGDGDGDGRRQPARLLSEPRQIDALSEAFGGEVLIQQRVLGRVISFAGVYAGGRLLGEAVSRYLRTWRPEAGNACYSQTIDAPEALRERVSALLDDIGWEGPFELELIEHPGGWHAIDLNPRIYGSMALAIGAGANLPAIWCSHVLGADLVPTVARPGVFYRWSDADLRHRLTYGHQELPLPRPRRGAQRPTVVHPHMRLNDPGPRQRGCWRSVPRR